MEPFATWQPWLVNTSQAYLSVFIIHRQGYATPNPHPFRLAIARLAAASGSPLTDNLRSFTCIVVEVSKQLFVKGHLPFAIANKR